MTQPQPDPSHRADGQPPADQREEYLEPLQGVKVRRAPNFVRFMLTGGILGFIAGFLVDRLGGDPGNYGPVSTFMYFGLGGAALGVLLGALVAVLLDRR